MRKIINAIVNVIRNGNRRNCVAEAVAAGVDALRASGPGYAIHHGYAGLGLESPRGGLLALRDSRSSLNASWAWPRLSLSTSPRRPSQPFAMPCFTATATATRQRRQAQPQAMGRGEQRRGIKAAKKAVAGNLASS